MKPDIDELERLAKASIPGPWDIDDEAREGCSGVIVDDECRSLIHVEDVNDDHAQWVATQEFIAAANPATVLELIAYVREVERPSVSKTSPHTVVHRDLLTQLHADLRSARDRIAELERERGGMVAISARDAALVHGVHAYAMPDNQAAATRINAALRAHGATWKGNEP